MPKQCGGQCEEKFGTIACLETALGELMGGGKIGKETLENTADVAALAKRASHVLAWFLPTSLRPSLMVDMASKASVAFKSKYLRFERSGRSSNLTEAGSGGSKPVKRVDRIEFKSGHK